jgi:hypothetical protein
MPERDLTSLAKRTLESGLLTGRDWEVNPTNDEAFAQEDQASAREILNRYGSLSRTRRRKKRQGCAAGSKVKLI